jgi:hypothetical protein
VDFLRWRFNRQGGGRPSGVNVIFVAPIFQERRFRSLITPPGDMGQKSDVKSVKRNRPI